MGSGFVGQPGGGVWVGGVYKVKNRLLVKIPANDLKAPKIDKFWWNLLKMTFDDGQSHENCQKPFLGGFAAEEIVPGILIFFPFGSRSRFGWPAQGL